MKHGRALSLELDRLSKILFSKYKPVDHQIALFSILSMRSVIPTCPSPSSYAHTMHKVLESLYIGDRFFTGKNIRLRRSGKLLTDIDFWVYDRSSRLLAIFQLKWQDPHRLSVRRRASQMKNFETREGGWVRKIEAWVTEMPLGTIGEKLGLKPSTAREIKGVLLFVISSHNCRFIGSKYPSGAGWSNIFEFIEIWKKYESKADSFNMAFGELSNRNIRPTNSSYSVGQVKIGGVEIELAVS